jgi:hypothetical protein
MFLSVEQRLQNISHMGSQRNRRALVRFDWSHFGRCFVLCRQAVYLPRIYKRCREHFLVACQIRQSRIRNSGLGIFLRESASIGQILLRYGGRKISFSEADMLKNKVQ